MTRIIKTESPTKKMPTFTAQKNRLNRAIN